MPQLRVPITWTGIATAIALVAIAVALQVLPSRAPDYGLEWLTFYPPLVVAALLGGFVPGAVATAISCLAVVILIPLLADETYPADSAHLLGVLVFLVNGCVISGLAEAMRRAQDRARAAQEQTEYQEIARGFFENSPSAMIAVDAASGRVVQANGNALRLWGYGAEEFLTKTLSDLILSEEAEQTRLRRESLASGLGEPVKFEQRLLRKDGSLFWGEIVVSGLKDAGGRIHTLLSSTIDVSERKHAEEALQKESRKSLALLRNASDGVHILDVHGNLLEASDSFFKMLGYARAEIIGKHVTVWDAQWAGAEMDKVLEQQFAKSGRFEFETRHRRKDGSIFAVEISGQVMDLTGETAGFFSARDISRRLIDEAALRESETRFRMLVEGAPQAIFVQTSGRFAYVNEQTLKLFGAEHKRQLLGQTIMDRIHPDYREEVRRRMQQTNLERRTTPTIEETYIRLDNSSVEVEVSAVPVRFGHEKGALVFAREITERRLAEQQQRIAAVAFESQEGMIITDASLVILRINQAFTQITGFLPEDVVGQTPRLLKSGVHDRAFYEAMWESVQRNGAWRGEIWNRRKNGEVFPEWLTITAVRNAGGQITNYVGALVDITAHKAAERKIEHLAFHDHLTELPNRRLLLDRLEQALAGSQRSERKGALLFLDLDNFKVLNDTSGHDVGDKLLVEVARRLVTCVRDGDTVARLGGDEFVIMLKDLSATPSEAANQSKVIGEKILSALNEPFTIDDQVLHSTPSIGVTLFVDGDDSVDDLLKQADIAMYEAKAAGRNTLRFFNPEMQAALASRAVMEAALRLAIHERQFILHFQPQVNMEGGVIGAEALLRWMHPERGLVGPGQFIGLAEETGLILPIGQWVLEAACARLRAWARDPATRFLTLAVNVSARQFRQPDFVDQVSQSLKNAGAISDRLKLELTESMVLEDIEDTIEKMRALKQCGVGFAIDDFGTGFSSLSYLTRLPLDQLKIDQSFVRNLPDNSSDAVVAQTIITMAKSLGLDVIAEGVETEAQRHFLAERGCIVYQGYLFSKPVPLSDFEQLLTRH